MGGNCYSSTSSKPIKIKATLTNVNCKPTVKKGGENLDYTIELLTTKGRKIGFSIINQDYQWNGSINNQFGTLQLSKGEKIWITIKITTTNTKDFLCKFESRKQVLDGFFDKNNSNKFETLKFVMEGDDSKNVQIKFENLEYKTIEKKLENKSSYDFAWKIDKFYDIMDANKGWTYERMRRYENDELQNIFLIVLIGLFNKGKTFIANMITGTDLAAGVTIHTEGPSLILDILIKGRAFLDNEGGNAPIPFFKLNNNNKIGKDELLQDRKASEWFQRNFNLENSHAITVIVGILSVQEQTLIDILNKSKPDKPKIIIHNFYQLKSFDAVIEQIMSDIMYSFDVFPIDYCFVNSMFPYYFKNINCETYHIVIVNKSNLELNKFFNENSIYILRALMADKFRMKQQFDLKTLVKTSLEKYSQNYFSFEKESENKLKSTITTTSAFCTERIYFEKATNFKKKQIESNEEGNFFLRQEKYQNFETLIYLSEKTKNKDEFNQIGENEVLVNIEILCYRPRREYAFEKPLLKVKNNEDFIQIEIKCKGKSSFIKIKLYDTKSNLDVGYQFHSYNKRIMEENENYYESDDTTNVIKYVIPLEQSKKNINSNQQNLEADDEKKILKFRSKFDLSKNDFEVPDLIIDYQTLIDEDNNNITGIETTFQWKNKNIQKNSNKWRIVGFVGPTKKGKSFLMNKLFNDFDSSNFHDYDTKSISCSFKTNDDTLILDSEGFYKSLKKTKYTLNFQQKKTNLLKFRNIKENIFQNFIFEKSKIFIIMVSHLAYSDQTYIEKIFAKLSKSEKKTVCIVHNLLDVNDKFSMDSKMKELQDYFKVQEKDIGGDLPDFKFDSMNTKYYKQIDDENLNVNHFFLADDSTEVGKDFNKPTIMKIKNMIKASVPIEIDIENEFNDFLCTSQFQEYFFYANSSIKLNSMKAEYPEAELQRYKFTPDSGQNIIAKPEINSLLSDENLYLEYKPLYELVPSGNDSETKILRIYFALNECFYNNNLKIDLQKETSQNKNIVSISGNRLMFNKDQRIKNELIIENTLQEGTFTLLVEICKIQEDNHKNACCIVDKSSSWKGGIFEISLKISQVKIDKD